LCRGGRGQLYAFCDDYGIAHRRIGKLIVAAEGEQPALERIERRAQANDVQDLIWLDARQANALEPAIRCESALLSPSTGIVDSYALMLSLLGQAENLGATVAYRTPVAAIEPGQSGLDVFCADPSGSLLRAKRVVNAAGLGATDIANRTYGLDSLYQPTLRLAKGNYFRLHGRCPFNRLIYPVPQPGGLGVHLTLDLAGQARFGPDVEWINTPDFSASPARHCAFEQQIRRYWPTLPGDALTPDYAGVRPKLGETGDQDFRIDTPAHHGIPGLLNLFGIESPGLTASLAIADYVADQLN